MIKKVPFSSSSMVSIGNANNYDGKPVYVDSSGRFALGWNYTFGYQPYVPTIKRLPGGIWTNLGEWNSTESRTKYKLLNNDLSFTPYDYYATFNEFPQIDPNTFSVNYLAYPYCAFSASVSNTGNPIYNLNGLMYYFDGIPIAVGSDGSMLSYYSDQMSYDNYLYEYDAQGNQTHRTDLNSLRIQNSFGDWVFKPQDPLRQNYDNPYVFSNVGSRWYFQFATPQGAYLTVSDSLQGTSKTTYYCGGGNVTQQQIPQTYQINANYEIRLSDLAIIYNDGQTTQTLANDPLGLLYYDPNEWFIPPVYIDSVNALDDLINYKVYNVNASREECNNYVWKPVVNPDQSIGQRVEIDPYVYKLAYISDGNWYVGP